MVQIFNKEIAPPTNGQWNHQLLAATSPCDS